MYISHSTQQVNAYTPKTQQHIQRNNSANYKQCQQYQFVKQHKQQPLLVQQSLHCESMHKNSSILSSKHIRQQSIDCNQLNDQFHKFPSSHEKVDQLQKTDKLFKCLQINSQVKQISSPLNQVHRSPVKHIENLQNKQQTQSRVISDVKKLLSETKLNKVDLHKKEESSQIIKNIQQALSNKRYNNIKVEDEIECTKFIIQVPKDFCLYDKNTKEKQNEEVGFNICQMKEQQVNLINKLDLLKQQFQGKKNENQKKKENGEDKPREKQSNMKQKNIEREKIIPKFQDLINKKLYSQGQGDSPQLNKKRNCQQATIQSEKSLKFKENKSIDQQIQKFKTSNQLSQDFGKIKLNIQQLLNKSTTFKSLNSIHQNKSLNQQPFSINQFQLTELLGQGTFSTVYRAIHKPTSFLCSIKIIPKTVINQQSLQNNLLNEIKTQLFLNHPNILKLYGFFANESKLYLILENVEQGDLYTLLKKQPNKRFSEKQVALYLRQICDALIYMHSCDIMHRDIKPENILITNGVAKLCDLGCAIYEQDKRSTFCGTIDYVSPEILKGERYDKNVDIWSIGVLAYELATGHAPFEGVDWKVTMRKICEGMLNLPKYLSANLQQLIQQILHKDKNLRMNLSEIIEHKWMEEQLKLINPLWNHKLINDCASIVR